MRSPFFYKIIKCFLPIVLLLAPVGISDACGPRPLRFHGYSFLNPNILNKKNSAAPLPLTGTFAQIYTDHFTEKDSLNINENLAEWQDRFCGLVNKADLAFIIYKASITDLEILLTNTRSKSLQVPYRLRGNGFAEYVWENKCTGTAEYLIFAKKCEPHVTRAADSWDAPKRDVEAMKELIAQGRKEFKQAKSHYMRLRYAYQIIRLAHYAGLYEETIKLYDKLMPKIDRMESGYATSIIPWWIEGHRAGALMRLGKRGEASYLYAKIFRYCPGRRVSAYQSFFIKTNEEWDECLRLCQSDEERAMLYAIRASNPKSRAVEEMEAIYRLDAANPQLEALLVQEIKKVERHLLGLKFNSRKEENKRRYGVPAKDIGEYVIALQAFVRKCREEGKVERPQLWRVAEGYLEFLAGDFYAADKTYQEAARTADDPLLKEQLEVFRLAMQIAQFKKPDASVEDAAYEIMKENKLYRKYPSFRSYLRDKMRWLYEQAGLNSKAFLCYASLDQLKPNPIPEMVDELLAVMQKPNQSKFERLLTEHFSTSDLLDMKAVSYLANGQLEAASEIYNRIPATEWDSYGQFNPFRENFVDRVNIEKRNDTTSLAIRLNRGELIQTLIDLEFRAKGDIEKAPTYYYKLGLAHYNMSYFGYGWRAMDYFRSGSTWGMLNKGLRGVYKHPDYPLGNKENTDLSRALYYFEKARLLAKTNRLKAKAAFQAARCEQKLFFMSEEYMPEPCCNNIPRLPDEYLVNFSRIKEEYQGTEVYNWAIKECKYFEVFCARGAVGE